MSITATFSGGAGITASFGTTVNTTFLALSDTPSSFMASKFLKVNVGGTAIEQVDAPGLVYEIGSLTDGATIAVNCLNYQQSTANLTTVESAVAYMLSNLGKVHNLSVKKNIAGDCIITFSGTGLVFVDMISDPDTESASLAVTHDGGNGGHKEISLMDSGLTDGSGDKIIYVRY